MMAAVIRGLAVRLGAGADRLRQSRLCQSRLCQSRLCQSRSGIAATEFALILPILMSVGLYGIELAHMASINMQISQIALSVADNASRMEQTDNSGVSPSVTTADADSVLTGGVRIGAQFNLAATGRIILTSLERDTASGKQYIHWQRCVGAGNFTSPYGNMGTRNGLSGAVITGLGSGATKITAPANTSVMFAEVFYQYTGLFGNMFGNSMVFHQEAAFITRDLRNLATPPAGNC